MTNEEVSHIFKGTFETELGKKCIAHLEEVFIKRDMYKPGMSLDEVAFRQGEASVVSKLIKEIRDGR